MKVKVCIELVAYTKPLEESDGSEIYIEVVKLMDVSFKPRVGAVITLSPIAGDHPNAERYAELVSKAPEIAGGKCVIESLMRDKRTDIFHVRCDYPNESYMSLPAVELIAEQLIVGYGFERNDY